MADGSIEAIPARYTMTHANEAIELYRGALRLSQGTVVYEGEGSVGVSWSPSPKINFELVATEAPERYMEPAFDAQLLLVDLGVTLTATPTGWSRSWSAPDAFTLHIHGRAVQEVDPTARARRVRFHVANFPDFHGAMVRSGTMHQAGHLELSDGDWKVTLDPCLSQSSVYQELRDGGYAITHVGVLERSDGETFEFAQADAEFELLDFFFSFVRGVWTTTCLFDELGDEESSLFWWHAPRVDPWVGRISCFPRMIVEGTSVRTPDLSTLLNEFGKLWRDSDWNDTLRWLVSWYLASNAESSLDIALLLAEAGLELVASAHARFGMTKADRKAIKSIAARLDHLLKTLGVNTAASHFKEMGDYMFSNSVSASRAVIDLRNAVVHADSARPSAQLRFDASRTARSYLELATLAKLGYRDRYLDRFFGFAEKKVPWA